MGTTSHPANQRRRTGISFEADGELILVDVERPFQAIDLDEAVEADRNLHAAYRDAHQARVIRLREQAARAVAAGRPPAIAGGAELPGSLYEIDPAVAEMMAGPTRLDRLEHDLRLVSGRWAAFSGDELVSLDLMLRRDLERDPEPAQIRIDLVLELEHAIELRMLVHGREGS